MAPMRQSKPLATPACSATVPAAEVIVYTSGGNGADAAAACGSWLASSASGGSSHSWNARSAPNQRRHGLRSAATNSTATVRASSASQPRAAHAAASGARPGR